MGEKLKVGGDVDAYCTRCKMDLAHTIVAMVGPDPVQVKCNTCDAFHKYRAPKSERGKATRRRATGTSGSRSTGSRSGGSSRSKAAAAPSAEEMETSWLDALSTRMGSEPKPYDVREVYTDKDVVQHPKFGKGAVVKVLPPKRMQVRFKDEERVLVMNYGKK